MKAAILVESKKPLTIADIDFPKKIRIWTGFSKNFLQRNMWKSNK